MSHVVFSLSLVYNGNILMIGENRMDLKDRVEFPSKIIVPDIFKNKLGACSNCVLMDKEILIFNKALYAVSQQLLQENVEPSTIEKFTTFFTLKGELNLFEQINNTFGVRFNSAVYMMENIRKTNSDVFMLFTFVEEMAHYYWHISNETLVKYKVEEIIQQVHPEFTLDYMRERWNLNGL